MLNCYQNAMIDQDFAFNIYRALRSGTYDDVNFDSWTSGVHSSLDNIQKSASADVNRESFEDEI